MENIELLKKYENKLSSSDGSTQSTKLLYKNIIKVTFLYDRKQYTVKLSLNELNNLLNGKYNRVKLYEGGYMGNLYVLPANFTYSTKIYDIADKLSSINYDSNGILSDKDKKKFVDVFYASTDKILNTLLEKLTIIDIEANSDVEYYWRGGIE